MVVFWFGVAIEEEILWRGLLYRLCAKVFGTWGALLLSAALFSVKHILDNPNVTFAAFAGVLLAGVFLGAAYAATGRLWLPIGLHFGWNFAEGTLFGTDVSGNSLGQALLTGKLIGPALWSGGKFGPEASVVAWIILIAASAYLLWRITKSKRAEPPIWRDATGIPIGAV
jgi:membrane protease YdiL (CAAX protease family)